jgi:hypothetical protein
MKEAEHVEEKFMLKDNFKKIITFISIFLLFFASSAHDNFVYAQMKAIDDNDLAEIQGAEGVTVGLNLTVGTVSGVNTSLTLSDEGGTYIKLPQFTIGNGSGGNFGINTNITVDVGTNSGRTWVYMNGIVLPSTAGGIGISSNGVDINGQVIGGVVATGLYLGQSVASVGYTLGNVPWVRLGTHSGSQGFEGYSEMGAYLDKVVLTASTASNLTISSMFVGSAAAGYTTGDASIGLNVTSPGVSAANPFGIDVGTNGTTMVRLSLPMAASIHINNFSLNGTNWGAIDLDNVIIYRQWVSIRNNL